MASVRTRVLWVVGSLLCWVVIAYGSAMTFTIEPTGEAMAEADTGQGIVALGGLATGLLCLAVGSRLARRSAAWLVGAPVAVGVVWTLGDEVTVFPMLATAAAGPLVLAGAILGALPARQQPASA